MNICFTGLHKCASPLLQWSYPFNEPVDTVRYDNYLNYVKRPIDFGTIKRSLETGAYKEPEAMLADVRQARISH